MIQKGIFCLEGLWEEDLRKKSSVRPMLELLEINEGINFIYRDCATIEELEFYLKKWGQKRYDNYPILYLAFHGEPKGIRVGSKVYSLDKLSACCEDKCHDSIILFGSCSTLDIDKRHLKRFLVATGALAVCGYKTDIDWMRSAAFELLLLSTLQENEFSGRGIEAIQYRANKIANMFDELEFRMVTNRE